MHIPDGFLDARTAAATAALSAVGVGYALRRVRLELPPNRVPLLGLGAAFIFSAQMLNFPVVGGTSGHLVGGALIAALLGPAAAVVVMTTVVIVQCLLFADGGLVALGANVLNMAIVGPLGGYAAYQAVRRIIPGLHGQVAAMAFAAWCSVVLAALACAGQLAWSGTVAWSAAFPAMTGVHMLIGVGEGAISALVLLAVLRTRPDLVSASKVSPAVDGSLRGFVGLGLLAAFALALCVAPFACPWPDGLESVAEALGFGHLASESTGASPMADYQVPGIGSAGMATAVAGVIGAIVVFVAALVLSRLLVRAPQPVDRRTAA